MEFLLPKSKRITLGDRIKALRGGLKVEELAGRSGLRPMCIVRLEQGVIDNPDLQTIRKIAHALGRDLSEFFEGVE
jgi:transcriptional regulator with XRE-family HTH domain